MQLIKPSYQILTPIDGDAILQSLELAGRVAWKSEDKITDDSAPKFCKMILSKNHESVIEHIAVTVKLIVDRGISHEAVRHRLSSFTQASSRYINYNKRGAQFIIPPWTKLKEGKYRLVKRSLFGATLSPPAIEYRNEKNLVEEQQLDESTYIFLFNLLTAEEGYNKLLNQGWKPQQARNILPNALATELIWTANLREWRHIFRLRTDKLAHPQMQEIMRPLLDEFKEKIPVIFDDINYAS